MQLIKSTMKEVKDKLAGTMKSSEMAELSYIKNMIITVVPNNVKQIISKFKSDKQSSLEELQSDLECILEESTKSYNMEISSEIDKTKRLIYKRLLDVETN